MDDDFELWKTAPGKYTFRLMGDLIEVFKNRVFSGHLQKKQLQKVEYDLMRKMESEEVRKILLNYQANCDFTPFYLKIFSDICLSYSQKEDLILMQNDFPTLVLKYKPLVEIVVNIQIRGYLSFKNIQEDFVQQIIESLLNKQAVILANFNTSLLFRNYLWTIIKNESVNIVTRETRFRKHYINVCENELPAQDKTANPINNLMLDDVFRLFDLVVNGYTVRKAKFIVCLKVELFLECSFNDLEKLISGAKNTISKEKISQIVLQLSEGHLKATGILHRFSIVKPLLNMADCSNTDENSYWRWTNKQIDDAIIFLNAHYAMRLDREVFKIMVEKYFANYFQP